MRCNFIVGQRVVFIGLGNFPNWPDEFERPIYGHVYTIREIRTDPLYPESIGILLKELVHPPVKNHPMGYMEYACCVTEWRLAVDCKTDISIFLRMVTDGRVSA